MDKAINKLNQNIYSKLLEWELTGVARFFREHDPVWFFTNTAAAIDIILAHPGFTDEEMLRRAKKMYFRWVKEDEKVILVEILRKWLLDLQSIDNDTIIRYISGCKRILWLPPITISLISNETSTPLLVFSKTMWKWLIEIEEKFEQLNSTHDSYIIIRAWLEAFQKEKNNISRFIQTSQEEIRDSLYNIHNLSRRPYAFYKICERLEREYFYIKEERHQLRSKIASEVKYSKEKNIAKASPLPEVNDYNDWLSEYNPEVDKASQEIHTLLIRVWNIRKKTWWKILRYIQSQQDPTEELEKIQERANILSRKFPELEDINKYIHDEIIHYHGFLSARTETLVVDSVKSIVDNKTTPEILSKWTERDFFAGKIINEYILYLWAIGSSTNATKENSIWDWRTFNQTIVPFLRFCINNLIAWKIRAENFSIWEAFKLFQDWMVPSVWNNKRSLQVYSEYFLSKNINGPFLETFPAIIDTLNNIWEIIENWRTEINGCGILIKRSKDFLQSNEWKSLCNKYKKCRN